MVSDFLTEIHQSQTNEIPERIKKISTGMYHNSEEPEHAFKDNVGSFRMSKEPIVTLLDYARALYLIANRYHTQIAN